MPGIGTHPQIHFSFRGLPAPFPPMAIWSGDFLEHDGRRARQNGGGADSTAAAAYSSRVGAQHRRRLQAGFILARGAGCCEEGGS
jgi:hypothetical protein